MKIYGLKYKVLLGIITISLLVVDIFLMISYGFEGQFLIFLYTMIGVVPLCGVFSLCSNVFIPTITFSYHSKIIITDFIANVLYKNDRHLRNQGDKFYFDEITKCEIDNKKMQITLKYGQVKTLNLIFFTKNQIHKIQKEIDKIINNK